MEFLDNLSFDLDRLLELSSLIDILLVTFIIFGLLMLIRGTRGMQLLRGLIVVALLLVILSSTFEQLPALAWLMEQLLPALLVAVPVIFQPELRRALEQVGRASQYLRIFRRQEYQPVVTAITDACLRLSQRRHGALIVIEQETGLKEYIDTGVQLDAVPSPELILTIFNKETDLHDGALIIRGDRIAAAAAVMPLSTSSLRDSTLGLRHRAALGISEVSDAVVVVVSEESGQISIAHNGRLIRRQDPTRLDVILYAFLQNRLRSNGSESNEQ